MCRGKGYAEFHVWFYGSHGTLDHVVSRLCNTEVRLGMECYLFPSHVAHHVDMRPKVRKRWDLEGVGGIWKDFFL